MPKRLKKELNMDARIVFRCSSDDLIIAEQAAKLDGRAFPDFLRFHLKEASEMIILKNRQKEIMNIIPEQNNIMRGMFSGMQNMQQHIMGKKS